jgi:hypothetical protein
MDTHDGVTGVFDYLIEQIREKERALQKALATWNKEKTLADLTFLQGQITGIKAAVQVVRETSDKFNQE